MNKSKINIFTKLIKNTVIACVVGFVVTSCEKDVKYVPKDVPKTDDLLKSYSYVLGFEFSRASTQVYTLRLDYDYFIAGFEAGYKQSPPIYDWKEIEKIKGDYTSVQLERSVKMDENKQKSFDSLSNAFIDYNPKFLAENKSKKGVIEMSNGVQYTIIKSTRGPKPNPESTVTINFIASLIDGKEFDNSYLRGIPIKGTLGKMMPSWIEIIKMMSVGDKIKAWLPPQQAFGATGIPNMVPPNAIVVMQFELEDIEEGGEGMMQEEVPATGGR